MKSSCMDFLHDRKAKINAEKEEITADNRRRWRMQWLIDSFHC